MRIPSGSTDRYIYFVAVDATDLKTRETGLTGFTVYRSRDGGVAAAYTTPTVNETDSANMPGVYELLIDEDTTLGSTHDTEEYVVHITQASMAPVTRTIEIYRPETTEGETLTVETSGMARADIREWLGTAVTNGATSGKPEVDAKAISDSTTAADNVEANIGNLNATMSSRSSHSAADIWSVGTRTLTSFGTLIADIWSNATRRITGFLGADLTETTAGRVAGNMSTFWGNADAATTKTVDDVGSGGGGSGETQLRSGTAQGGGASTIILDAGASSNDDHYKHAICAIEGGTGAGQSQIIDSYVGATKVATMAASWAVTPDATSQFVILPLGTIPGASAPSAAQVADAVFDEARADHKSAGSFGESFNRVHADAANKKVADKNTVKTTVYEDDDTTVSHERTLSKVDDDKVALVPV